MLKGTILRKSSRAEKVPQRLHSNELKDFFHISKIEDDEKVGDFRKIGHLKLIMLVWPKEGESVKGYFHNTFDKNVLVAVFKLSGLPLDSFVHPMCC